MKAILLTISLLASMTAFATERSDNPGNLGPQPGDSCYCPTCLGHNKCSNTLYNEDRRSGDEGRRRNSTRPNNKRSKNVQGV